jgi:aryl-alcohol dehydrogenase (NADP+)
MVYREEEREMIPLCKDQNIGIIPWSPLARGFLAGNRKVKGEGPTKRAKSDGFAHELYYRETDFNIVDQTVELAKKRGVSPSQIALAWMTNKPWITAPIIGAGKARYIDEAVAALDIKLTPEEVASLEEPYEPHEILGHR